MAVLHRLQHFHAIPPQNARPNLDHPFFLGATEWRLSWQDQRWTQNGQSRVILASRSCLLRPTKFGQALFGDEASARAGVRIAFPPAERHISVWAGSVGGNVHLTNNSSGRNYVNTTQLVARGGTSFAFGGDAGTVSSGNRRTYLYANGGDIYVLRPAASITTAPDGWVDGKAVTISYSSGTAASYGWGDGSWFYQLSYNVPGNSLVNIALPFYAATNKLTVDDDVLKDLSLNPWALWKPKPIWVAFTAAAATGAPTITDLQAVNITASNAQPRISYS